MDLENFMTIWFVIILSVVLLSISYLIVKTANSQISGMNTYKIEMLENKNNNL